MISNVKSGIVFMAMMALSCSVAYADILWYQWYGLIENPLHIRPNNETVEGYGFNSLSSYVTGDDSGTGYITYYDWEPPLGSPGFSNRYIEATPSTNGGPPRFTGDFSGALTGLMLAAKLVRLSTWVDGSKIYLLHVRITNPKQLLIMNSRHPTDECVPAIIETWEPALPAVLYTAPDGFEINAISATTMGATKFIAVSISSHGVPGPVMMLVGQYDNVFELYGPVTKEDGTPIVAWESFTLFSAASPKRHINDALFIYYVESATGAGQLLYSEDDDAGWSTEFSDVAELIPFNAGDAMLSGQLGTAVAVNQGGTAVLLLRHGSVICSTGEERTVMQKMYYPSYEEITPEQPVLVQNTDGTIIPVDALSMPALISDRCFDQVTPGYQTGLVWIDRVSLLLRQAVANSFNIYA